LHVEQLPRHLLEGKCLSNEASNKAKQMMKMLIMVEFINNSLGFHYNNKYDHKFKQISQ
jgi:hypothetical protein